MTIDAIIEGVLGNEGGYSDHPSDRGGATMWGITEAVARANGWTSSMRDLPRSFAKGVYLKRYVVEPGFDQIAALSTAIGAELVDTGVNMGPSVASQMLQRALNALNRQQRDYVDIAVDGMAFTATRGALRAYLNKRGPEGEEVLLRALNCLQGERYIDLAEKRPANEDFLYGWLRTRVA